MFNYYKLLFKEIFSADSSIKFLNKLFNKDFDEGFSDRCFKILAEEYLKCYFNDIIVFIRVSLFSIYIG